MPLLVVRDGLLATLSIWAALILRFEGNPPSHLVTRLLWLSPLVFFVFVLAGASRGLYRDLPQYTSIWELTRMGEAVALTTIVLLLVARFVRIGEAHLIPLSIPLIGALIMLYSQGAARLFKKIAGELRFWRKPDSQAERVLIVGAGDAGEMIARDMLRNPASGLVPVGFLDDDPAKQKKRIHGRPVVGRINDLEKAVSSVEAAHVIIAMPSVPSRVVRGVVGRAAATGATAKIVASMREAVRQPLTTEDIRDVDVADLIGRKPIRTRHGEIAGFLRGRRVLITGAAGSIGSELARQVLRFSPGKLWLMDHNESDLFTLNEELSLEASNGSSELIQTVIADVRDAFRTNHVFAMASPEVVIHSAAYKHVPLMEAHPAEAVITNIVGTRHVVEAAGACKAEKVVLISTDKAVEPISVMGATKRVAEMIVATGGEGSRTNFTAVRFGNVLGSRGSVVPVFMNQIRRGRPITVTDPEVTRFFMTIEESVSLILQAAAIANDGEIFMLDMGEPVRILELAERMRDLLAQDLDEAPEIVISGMRPGEKMHETLWAAEEDAVPSGRDGIFRTRTGFDHGELGPEFRASLRSLESLALARADEDSIRGLLFKLANTQTSPTRSKRVPKVGLMV